MRQNGPSCGTQAINTLLWSGIHIGFPHKQHYNTWHTRHPHAHIHAYALIPPVVLIRSLMRTCINWQMIQARLAQVECSRRSAATWWNQTLQMRAGLKVQRCSQRHGETERQRETRKELYCRAIIRQRHKGKAIILMERKAWNWLVLQLTEVVFLLPELCSQGFVSCHLPCDLHTCTLRGENIERVCLLMCLSECNGGWGGFLWHTWWQVRHSMPPHYSYSRWVEGAKRG